ncbi:MAG: Adenylosuccinate lyase [Syntrophaceae bacterium PtaB.Bin038]|nr:MAG: Adenylosuccinate lyase [Syntrophaceae bacterium PtaB.Bin038]
MIPRYARKEMEAIWSPENRFRKWLDIELLVCEALAAKGEIPRGALRTIRAKAGFDVGRIDEIERTVKHDVIAFLTSVAEHVGPDSRYIHMGLTSSDILDTSLAVLLKEASGILLADIDHLLGILKKKALRHRKTLMIGRTHGIHAEPVTFGLKMAVWHQEMQRNRERLVRARDAVACGKISGAVGTFAFVDPGVEEHVCRKLGLTPEPAATQIVQRDRHAEFFATLALIASSLEKFSTEIRHLQRTEVREAEEYFSPGQKGSSAMPHKRNPVLSENLSGLARLMRGYALAAMENIALWHERDISHSSVERVIAPDATILLDFMLNRFAGLVENLVVYPERMMENLRLTRGVIFSQQVLLKLVERKMTREQAYAVVQENAMRAWQEGLEFKDLLLADERVRSVMGRKEIEGVFRLESFLENVDYIYDRVFGRKRGRS